MATEPVVQGRVAQREPQAVVATLRAALGERLVAVMAGADDAALVRKWASGKAVPPPEIDRRLQTALDVVELLAQRERPDTIRAWWTGMNPDLGNEAPALVLQHRPDRVRDAAMAYLAE